ncbi:MAG: orotidine-5'-phosphate decarboxylase [Planctomycetota bacterium]|nr:MAG: orotidine-5'-phosphate decarboxylase [Planctomycetota bacterium]REK21035.1 MAG: orotidine-5'-phosphate decarboxylase [Planctomycetota bacterium]REK38853.1 MAG: orotidine-5'-phosphate decarboxylase [Planctomycetota bacterium]
MTSYSERLNAAIREKRTPALVGLDPRWDALPAEVRGRRPDGERGSYSDRAEAFREFCCRIIDVVAPLVPAVKPQAAFFEECGHWGAAALAHVIGHARQAGLIVICDAKRGDIGSTAEAYARAYLAGDKPEAAPWGADALTVNPYLGADTLQPFVSTAVARGAGIYVLVRTSNPGAGHFQDRRTEGEALFECVAQTVEELARGDATGDDFGPVGAVVGATYPEELAALRLQMPHVPLLIPGYGSQGGTAADVAGGFREDGLGAVVNSSRGIIFAYHRAPYEDRFPAKDWERAVEAATHDMIQDLADHTPAGALRRGCP